MKSMAKILLLCGLLISAIVSLGPDCSLFSDDDDNSGNSDGSPTPTNDDDADDDSTPPCYAWQDPETELWWETSVESDVIKSWQGAVNYCANQKTCGQAGWYLPSIEQLRSLIRGCAATVLDGSCPVWEDCLSKSCANGCSCDPGGGPAEGGCYYVDEMVDWKCSEFWSSTEVADDANDAWYVYFGYGGIGYDYKDSKYDVRCVHD